MSYRIWIFIASGLFIIGIVLGLATPGGISGLLTQDLEALQELGTILGPFKLTTAAFIYLKNVTALLFSFILSPILCLAPVITLMLNGWLIAFVSATLLEQQPLGVLLGGLLPHGILEIPALVIGEAAALSFGAMVMTAAIFREKRSQLKPHLMRTARYLILALALLLPAAIIETYVTPLFIR
jgi:stage II sporulation protein M